ncbi:MAG: HAD-IB family phosphatase [Spirochaetia bacterium]|nr:HAD-IB family phosphatase [Spirochaetia bacterium]
MSKKIALFDMDYTIIPYDSLIPFAGYVLSREPWRFHYIFAFIPACVLYIFGIIGREGLKRAFLSVLWRMKKERVEELAKDFAQKVAIPLLFPEIMADVRRLKANGFHVILNSASPTFYVNHIGAGDFDEIVATDVVLEAQMPFLPRINGRNNRGIEKLLKMPALVPAATIARIHADYSVVSKNHSGFIPDVIPGSIAYSDSSADLPMLRMCENAVLVHPSEKLAAEGKSRGWKIVQPARPYKGSFEKYVRLCMCLVGLLRLR